MAGDRTRYMAVTYDGWRRGCEYYANRKTSGGAEEIDLSYMSSNMQVYDTGQIGVRPWLRSWDMSTGLTLADTILQRAQIQYRQNDSERGELWCHPFSNDIAFYDFATSTWAYHTGLDALVTTEDDHATEWGRNHGWDSSGQHVGSGMHVEMPTENFIFSGEGLINAADNAVNMDWVDAVDPIVNFCMYRDRVYGWVQATTATTNTNRLFYTDASNYRVAAANNFIDIGAASSGYWIVGCWAVRDSLLIAMSNNTWWAITGEPDTGALRYVGEYVTPAHGAAGAVLNNQVVFNAPYGRQLCVATPQGVDTKMLQHVRPFFNRGTWNIFHDYRALSSASEQALHMTYQRNDQDQWWVSNEMVNGSWMYHKYGDRDGSTDTSNMGFLRDLSVVGGGKAYAFLCEDASQPNGTEIQIYTRDIVLNRPSRSDDFWSSDIEGAAADPTVSLADGWLQLAAFTPPSGQEVRIHHVTIDYTYWYDADEALYNRCNFRMQSVAGNGYTILNTYDTYEADNEGLTDIVSGVIGFNSRYTFHASPELEKFSHQARVRISSIISLAIDRIVVEYEIRPLAQWAGRQTGT